MKRFSGGNKQKRFWPIVGIFLPAYRLSGDEFGFTGWTGVWDRRENSKWTGHIHYDFGRFGWYRRNGAGRARGRWGRSNLDEWTHLYKHFRGHSDLFTGWCGDTDSFAVHIAKAILRLSTTTASAGNWAGRGGREWPPAGLWKGGLFASAKL